MISVLIPTYNEEIHLSSCLASIKEWASEIVIVDSFSTDRTQEIAKSFGATFVRHQFEGYALQKNWALDNVPISNEWVLILDADERLTAELRGEIADIVKGGGGYAGYYLNRRFIFYGKWIRHCGWYPSWNLRLFRHGLGRYEQREVDEHLILNGSAGYCQHDMIHEDLRGMEAWISKHNCYSTYNARIYSCVVRGGQAGSISPRIAGGQAERKRFIKQYIWPHLPGRAVLFFLYMYFCRLGFLDGVQGFHFCVMHAIFQQFVVVKQWEQRQQNAVRPVETAATALSPAETNELNTGWR